MDEEAVRRRVRTIILDMAPLRAPAIETASDLRLDLGYDSLSLLELAGVLEGEFGLPEADDDDYDVETVGEVERTVLGKLEWRSTPS